MYVQCVVGGKTRQYHVVRELQYMHDDAVCHHATTDDYDVLTPGYQQPVVAIL